MRILIDIGHPAHVHLFKNFAWLMQEKGHEILFTVRDKEFEIYLLTCYGFKYKSFGRHFKSKPGKILGLLLFDLKMIIAARSFSPDIFLSHGSVYAAHTAWIMQKPHIALEDTGNMEQIRLYLPFTSVVLTSIAFHKELGNKQIRYNGYHELAYLHPKRFSADQKIREVLNLKQNEHFYLLRFVSWNASHDFGQKGLTLKDKKDIVEKLLSFGKVFISSEEVLPAEFEKYKIVLPPDKIHDVLAYTDLFIGEGATMASECAMLGTPAIYVNTMEAGTIDDQEREGLLFHFRKFNGVIDKALEIINKHGLREEFTIRRAKMIKNKIDVTAFLIWFIENYPRSSKTMKENHGYQERFK
jgi:predicted glycosyltransferase